jgi:hypothetical protein
MERSLRAFAEGAAEVAEAVSFQLVRQPLLARLLALGEHLPDGRHYDGDEACARCGLALGHVDPCSRGSDRHVGRLQRCDLLQASASDRRNGHHVQVNTVQGSEEGAPFVLGAARPNELLARATTADFARFYYMHESNPDAFRRTRPSLERLHLE